MTQEMTELRGFGRRPEQEGIRLIKSVSKGGSFQTDPTAARCETDHVIIVMCIDQLHFLFIELSISSFCSSFDHIYIFLNDISLYIETSNPFHKLLLHYIISSFNC